MKHFTKLPSQLTIGWVILLLLAANFTASHAQMRIRPGVMDTCYASPEVMNTKVYAESELAEMKQFRRNIEARTVSPNVAPPTKTAEFIVNYEGFTPEAKAAFQYAVDIWSTIVVSEVPIQVDATFLPLNPGVLGSAGPTLIFENFSDEVTPDTWYPSALADAIAGEDLAEGDSLFETLGDIRTRFSSTFNWYYGTDLNPAPDQYDFVTIVLHELGHGLGFTGAATVDDSTDVGFIRIFESFPWVYSNFVENGEGTPILAFEDSTKVLADQLTGGDLFVNGEHTVAAFGGEQPELFAPDPWDPGSSYSHWNEESFPAGDSNSLMTPFAGFAEANHRVGAITKGFFKDMGWTINEAPVALISLRQTAKVSPAVGVCVGTTPTTDEIGVLPGQTVCLYYTVSNRGDLPLTLHSLRDTQGGMIFDDVEQVLAPGASLTVTRQLQVQKQDLPLTNIATWTASNPGEVGEVSATAVTKLFFAPIANVSPDDLVAERAEQGERELETLSISNTGGTPLVYRTVVRETDAPMAERVAESEALIAQAGDFTASSLRNWSPSVDASSSYDESGFEPIPYDGEALRAVRFATDFESFEVGPLGTQNGWVGTDDTLALITNENAFSGQKHLRLLTDTTKDNYSVFSPAIRGGAEPFSSFSVKLNLLDTGAQYRIFPAQLTEENELNIGGAVLIASTGEVFVFVGGQGYTSTGYVLPRGYAELKYVSSRLEDSYDLYVDDQLIADDITSFSRDVDVVEFRTYNNNSTQSGVALDIDDIELIDGDAAAPNWVAVEPAADTVPVNTQVNADIVFDATGLTPGVYKAEITVLTNDPFSDPAVVPVQLTVTERPDRNESLDLDEVVLVDAEADQIIRTLEDGDVLDLSELPDITLAAVPTDDHFEGFIEFFIDGEKIQREKFAPYALAGDNPRGDYNPYDFTPGEYELKVVSSVPREGQEPRTDDITLRFTVVDDADLATLVVVNAETDQIIRSLEDGDALDLGELPDITLAAVPTDEDFDGYIEFFINGERIQREKFAPYALAGDDPRGDYNPYNFASGEYELRVVAYRDGETIDAITVSFTVVGGDAALAARTAYKAYPNPVKQSFTLQSETDKITHYTVIDNLGRTIVSEDVDHLSTVAVDMSPYFSRIRSAGLFYVRVESENQVMKTFRMTTSE